MPLCYGWFLANMLMNRILPESRFSRLGPPIIFFADCTLCWVSWAAKFDRGRKSAEKTRCVGSRSFKVIEFVTTRKGICDFLINDNLGPILPKIQSMDCPSVNKASSSFWIYQIYRVYTVSKNCAKLFLSVLRQISTNFFYNFWRKDSKEAKIMWGVLISYLT